MRKWPFIVVLTILIITALFVPALSAPYVQVAVDGQYVSFPDELPYLDTHSSRTMVPARFVAEKLGARVQWNGQLNQVIFTYKDQTILLPIGQNRAQVNGKEKSFDAPAVLKNGRTMVPLRFVSEVFGAKVSWVEQRNLAVVTTAGHAEVVPSAPEKGTWIWNTKIIEADQDSFFRFARDNAITAIYLHVDKDVNPKAYQSFISRADAQQIKVEALIGTPRWVFTSSQDQIKDYMTWVKQYNASADANERFVGLHFDIEPYLLDEWKNNQRMVIEHWMDNMRFIESETKGTGLKVTLDVPFWVHKIKIPDSTYTLSAWLLEKFDCLVLMDYRNFALGNDGIVENANTILKEASTLKKQVIVAVDTAKSTEGERTTFFSLNTDAMERELQIVRGQLSRFASFAGVAVHDYKNWTALDQQPRP
ncbi:copper amine oxidase N-terminal domain-containing protein [Brevibacillus sp. B_LB10_24]|uniref:copper amine oxidase N-terminal domain-containing protein n=1 Tax=Brevibacillus sp. B_LB10_24 TaxID=3380645 RepID=UPI0038BD7952